MRYRELSSDETGGESSADIRAPVDAVCLIQLESFHARRIVCNAQMTPREIKRHCRTDADCARRLESAMTKLNLSA